MLEWKNNFMDELKASSDFCNWKTFYMQKWAYKIQTAVLKVHFFEVSKQPKHTFSTQFLSSTFLLEKPKKNTIGLFSLGN